MTSKPRLLLVKLSSLGDVIHNLPVATDIRRAFPEAVIDWVTEAPYAPLVALHPAVQNVKSLHLRQLKRQWFLPIAWRQLFDDKAKIASAHYDKIIDSQGLLKSALVARWANGPIAGYDRNSIREPAASRWYQEQFSLSTQLHAVERNRGLAAAALGYTHTNSCDYGLPKTWPSSTHAAQQGAAVGGQYVVCLHATSRADKCWPIASWVALGHALNGAGWQVVLPSGTAAEYKLSQAVASQLRHAVALTPLSLPETAGLLAGAAAVVGVDTGLAHLAVALQRPTIGLYLTTQPALTGLYGPTAINLGGRSRSVVATIAPAQVFAQLAAAVTSGERPNAASDVGPIPLKADR